MEDEFFIKYLEYKLKYLKLKSQLVGGRLSVIPDSRVEKNRAAVLNLFKKCYSDKYDDKTIENTCYLSISKNDDYKKLLKALEPKNNSKCIDSARKKANICINAREKRNYSMSKLRKERKELPPLRGR
jgi:hypothetical protein